MTKPAHTAANIRQEKREMSETLTVKQKLQQELRDLRTILGNSNRSMCDELSSLRAQLAETQAALDSAIQERDEYKDIAESMVAAFDEFPIGTPDDIIQITRECALSVAKQDLGWNEIVEAQDGKGEGRQGLTATELAENAAYMAKHFPPKEKDGK